MTAPEFELRESRTWVRTSTHTVIREGEPDYARFVASGEGYVQRVLRIWLVGPADPHALRAYLGSVTMSRAWPRLRDLRRVYRRAESESRAVGLDCSRSEARAALRQVLRSRMPAAARAARSG